MSNPPQPPPDEHQLRPGSGETGPLGQQQHPAVGVLLVGAIAGGNVGAEAGGLGHFFISFASAITANITASWRESVFDCANIIGYFPFQIWQNQFGCAISGL